MKLTKDQKTELKKLGWTPCQPFWFGTDWNSKKSILRTISEVQELPEADGYDFVVVGYKKVNY